MNFREIMMTLNSNIKVPLNKLIENKIKEKPNGFCVTPYKKQYSSFISNTDYNNYGSITVKDCIKKDNELYVIDDSGYLKVIQLTKAATIKSLKLLTDSNYTNPSLLAVTKTYIYGKITDSSTSTVKVFRYNKDTGEYKVSVSAIGEPYNINYSVFVSYEDELFMYVKDDGYYTVTDVIDLNGSLTFLKLNNNYLNTATNQSLYNYNYNSIRCEIELPNRTVLIVVGSSSDKVLILYKMNVDDGSWSVVKNYGSVSSIYGYTLTPIKYNDKIVGVLFGCGSGNDMGLYKIDSNNDLTLLQTYNNSSTTSSSNGYILTYDNDDGKIYRCNYTNPRYMYNDINLLPTSAYVENDNGLIYYTQVVYLPKGTKVAQGTDNAVYRIKPKLRDVLIFDNNELVGVNDKIQPNENGVVTIDEDGLYVLYTYPDDTIFYGTLF